MNLETSNELVAFLKENLDAFAWVHRDMVGISLKTTCHRLNIDLAARSIRQKRRSMDVKCSQTLKVEVDRLLNINFIRKVKYPDWLANPVLLGS